MTQCHPHSCHLCLLSVRSFPTVRLCQGPLAWGVCSFEGSRGSRRQALAFPWLCAAYIPGTLRPYCVFSVSQLFIHTIPFLQLLALKLLPRLKTCLSGWLGTVREWKSALPFHYPHFCSLQGSCPQIFSLLPGKNKTPWVLAYFLVPAAPRPQLLPTGQGALLQILYYNLNSTTITLIFKAV